MNLSFNLNDWQEFCKSSSYSPENVLLFLNKDFGELFKQDAAVWEGYTLGEHTIMVLRQFEKYFSMRILPGGFELNIFRIVLALHDIGKIEAIQNGGKHLQHKYTMIIIDKIFKTLKVKKKWILITESLICCDPLGKYLRNPITLEKTQKKIFEMAKRSGLSYIDFFDLLQVFFKVDAGSYTTDAGGLKSLDFLFHFDQANHSMNFSEGFSNKIEELYI